MDQAEIDLKDAGVKLHGLDRINILLGKNGAGKSRILRLIDKHRAELNVGRVRYILPERSGVLEPAPSHESDLNRLGDDWMSEVGRVNQYAQFKQQSVVLLKRLELTVLRRMEKLSRKSGKAESGFDEEFALINSLLERVQLDRREDQGLPFTVVDRETGTDQKSSELSSGESELVALAIEVLHFRSVCCDEPGLLLIDEPDVHLHPDLQDRLAAFIIDAFRNTKIRVLLATHSTALVAGFAARSPVHLSFLKRQQDELAFRAVSDIDRAILPIFGAHPLSALFTKTPLLLVEGTDEERIWNQAVRSSNGAIRFQVCEVGGKGNFCAYENEVNALLSAVYDDAKAFSIRDRDDEPEHIDDHENVLRCRLNCRASENLLLTNECLTLMNQDWETLKSTMDRWIVGNPDHQAQTTMAAFKDQGYPRKSFDLKEIRNVLSGLIGNKPWEVVVGQGIAVHQRSNKSNIAVSDGSLADFLGKAVRSKLLFETVI